MSEATNETGPAGRRAPGEALLRGFRRRCPSCGQGRLFAGYLSVNPVCPACGIRLDVHRADDGPPYVVILLVGHITVPALAWVFAAYRPEPIWLALGFATVSTLVSLWLLPRVKGAIIGYQWAHRMFGFGRA